MKSKGKIIRLETYFEVKNSYVEYMWVRIYIDKCFTPLVTPFFEFMNVFTGDSNELEKLINSEIEWTLQSTKYSNLKILNQQEDHFIYAKISKIIYSRSYSNNVCFDFKKIQPYKNGIAFSSDKKIIINLEDQATIYKEFLWPFDTFSYSTDNFILYKRNEQTRKLEIIVHRHCRDFYKETRFFNTYNDKAQFLILLDLHKQYTLSSYSEQPHYDLDDIVNDAFEGDYSNLWNID